MHICVFCSSSNAISDIYFEEARKLGEIIGREGHVLVNGGANVGLMEAVTIAERKNGGKTTGISPERNIDRSLAYKNSHQVIVTKNMMERKAKMREISYAFIALPGGFGTLEEILEVMTLRQLSYHNKPVILVNTNNFFRHLIKQFETSFDEQFTKKSYKKLYFIANSVKEAFDFLKSYKPEELDSKWYVVPENNKVD